MIISSDSRLTTKEFAEHCNTTVGVVNVTIKRKQVNRTTDGLINPNTKINKAFIKKREELDKSRGIDRENLPPPIDKSAPKEGSIEDWKKKKIVADARKAEHDADLRRVQLQKAMGKVIPVELLNQILKINIQGVFIGFEQELQNIAAVYCDILAGGDRGKLGEITDQMREVLERIINNTGQNVKKEVKNAIEEFQEARTRGESKAL